MSCFVQCAPYALADGGVWDDARRDALGDTVLDTLAEFAPGIRDRVLHRQVLTPLDLEREFGLSEGNIFHGELTPDQLFFVRPGPGWARHRRRSAASTSAAPRPTPAAASWAPPAATPPESSAAPCDSSPALGETPGEAPGVTPGDAPGGPQKALRCGFFNLATDHGPTPRRTEGGRGACPWLHPRSARPPRPSSLACSCWRRPNLKRSPRNRGGGGGSGA